MGFGRQMAPAGGVSASTGNPMKIFCACGRIEICRYECEQGMNASSSTMLFQRSSRTFPFASWSSSRMTHHSSRPSCPFSQRCSFVSVDIDIVVAAATDTSYLSCLCFRWILFLVPGDFPAGTRETLLSEKCNVTTRLTP